MDQGKARCIMKGKARCIMNSKIANKAKTIISEERMMNRQTRRKDNKDERGSALVLTLGILSLVLIMGMSFAFSSRTSRQVAKVNADQVKANLHGESGLDYALGVMQEGFWEEDADGNDVPFLYPAGHKLPNDADDFEKRFEFKKYNLGFKDGDGNWAHQHIWSYVPKDNKADNSTDDEVETDDVEKNSFDTNRDKHSFYYTLMNEVPQLRLQTLQFVEDSVDSNLATDEEQVKKSKVKEYLEKIGFHTITSDDEIVGRVGFLVLEEGHKFDVNQMLTLKIPASGSGNIPFVEHDKLERCADLYTDWDTTNNKDYYYNITGEYKPTENLSGENGDTFRWGLHMQELDTGVSAYYDNLLKGAEIDGVSTKVRWMSYDHLWKGLCPSNAKLDDIYDDSLFKDDHMRFTFFSAEEPESWWYKGDDGDDGGFEVTRFDVTGYEWRESDAIAYYTADGSEIHPSTTAKANGWEGSNKAELIQNLAFVKNADGEKQDKDDLPKFSKKNDDYEESDCIPALASMKDKDGNSVALQVAANMVDYCDGDDYANYLTDPADVRSDLTSTEKITSDFKIVYCGNEQVAYLNELALRFTVTRFHDVENHTYKYTMKMLPQLELANMYCDNDHDDDGKVPDGKGGWTDIKGDKDKIVVRIKGTYEIKNCTNPTHGILIDTAGHTNDHESATSTGDIDLVFQKNNDGTWDDGYITIELEPVSDDLIFEYKENAVIEPADPTIPDSEPQDKAANVDYTVKITEVSIVSWKDSATDPTDTSEKSDRVYDIGLWKASDVTDDDAKFFFDYGFTDAANGYINEYLYSSLEANDPRCNHRTAGWAWVKKRVTGAPELFVSDASEDAEDFSDSDFHTLGKENKNFKPTTPDEYYGTDGIMDKEKSGTKIFEISTAYIRNAPFETLWELGAIHRGEPFRTINLSIFSEDYNAASSFSGKYAEGDAHMLDQVKIGPAHYSRGKFNVNSRSEATYIMLYDKELFGKDDTYDDPSKKGDDLQEPEWGFLDEDNKLIEPHYNRGQIANLIANLDDDGAYDNDRQMESFIGRTANLLTTRNEAYTVIVISQALQQRKDLETALTTAGMGKTDAVTKEMLRTNMANPTWYKVYEDADTSKEHLCEILGTNVIMAHVVRDAWTGKMTVVKKEYLNSSK